MFLFILDPFLGQSFGGKWSLPLGDLLTGLASMILIAYAIALPDPSPVSRLLNHKLLVWLGVISYSLYIWHQLLFHFDVPGTPMWASRILITIASLAVAIASYYLLELPIMRSRERLWSSLVRRPTLAVDLRSEQQTADA